MGENIITEIRFYIYNGTEMNSNNLYNVTELTIHI